MSTPERKVNPDLQELDRRAYTSTLRTCTDLAEILHHGKLADFLNVVKSEDRMNVLDSFLTYTGDTTADGHPEEIIRHGALEKTGVKVDDDLAKTIGKYRDMVRLHEERFLLDGIPEFELSELFDPANFGGVRRIICWSSYLSAVWKRAENNPYAPDPEETINTDYERICENLFVQDRGPLLGIYRQLQRALENLGNRIDFLKPPPTVEAPIAFSPA